MGYVASYAGTEKITLPSNPTYWVELRKCLSRAQLQQAEGLLSQATVDMNGNGTVKPDIIAYRNSMVAFSIASWNLDDEAGNILPIVAATVGLLAGPDFDAVYTRVDQLNKGMTEQEQARFPEQG
jgi:hypothetical protein